MHTIPAGVSVTDQRVLGYEIVPYWKGFPSSDVPHSESLEYCVIPHPCMFPVDFPSYVHDLYSQCSLRFERCFVAAWIFNEVFSAQH